MNIESNNNFQGDELKISRGYRLKVSTHNLIKSLQELTQSDSDAILTQSCLMLYKKVLEEKENILKNNQ